MLDVPCGERGRAFMLGWISKDRIKHYDYIFFNKRNFRFYFFFLPLRWTNLRTNPRQPLTKHPQPLFSENHDSVFHLHREQSAFQPSIQRLVTCSLCCFCSPEKIKSGLAFQSQNQTLSCFISPSLQFHQDETDSCSFTSSLNDTESVPSSQPQAYWRTWRCTGCLGNFVKQKYSERQMTFVRVVSVKRSRPPTQEGVGACKWTTWGSGAFCLKDCCLIHLRHARCTALRGNRQEPPLCAARDIIY